MTPDDDEHGPEDAERSPEPADPPAMWRFLNHRIEALRATLAATTGEERAWPLLELCEELVNRFEFRLRHDDLLGEPGPDDLLEVLELSAIGSAREPIHLALIWAGVVRAIAQLYLMDVDPGRGRLDDTVERLRLVRGCADIPTDTWALAGELLGRALDGYLDLHGDGDPDDALAPLLAEAVDLLDEAEELTRDEQERGGLAVITGRLRLWLRSYGRWRDDPAADAAQRDLAIAALTRATDAGTIGPFGVYGLADALVERYRERSLPADLSDAVAALRAGLELPELPEDARGALEEFLGSLLMEQGADAGDAALMDDAIRVLTRARDALPRGDRLMAVLSLAEALIHRGGSDRASPAEAGELLDCLVEILQAPDDDIAELEEFVVLLAGIAVQQIGGTALWSPQHDRALGLLAGHLERGTFHGPSEAVLLGTLGAVGLRGMIGMWRGGPVSDIGADLRKGLAWLERALAHPDLAPEAGDGFHGQAAMYLVILATVQGRWRFGEWSSARLIEPREDLGAPDVDCLVAAQDHLRQLRTPGEYAGVAAVLPLLAAVAREAGGAVSGTGENDGDTGDDENDDDHDYGALLRQLPLEVALGDDPRTAWFLLPVRALAVFQLAKRSGTEADLVAALAVLRHAHRAQPPGSVSRAPILLAVAEVQDRLAGLRGDAAPATPAAPSGGTEPLRQGPRVWPDALVELDALVERLEAVAVDVGERSATVAGAGQLMDLAAAYRRRGRLRPAADGDDDRIRVMDTVRLSLREYARCVLLADSVDEGLAVAAAAQQWLPTVVGWCVEDGVAQTAVGLVEAGRGLVLAAVTASGGVAQLLSELGEPQLAGMWAGSRTPAAVRHQALRLLGRSARGMLLEAQVTTVDDVSSAVWAAGVDAVVYLLPPDGVGGGGGTLVVRTGGVVEHVLHGDGDGDSDGEGDDGSGGGTVDEAARYQAAYARMLATAVAASEAAASDADGCGSAEAAAYAAAMAEWRAQLHRLGGWAHDRVMGPLLERTRGWGLLRPPRLVLVPVGSMATVPWHAAWCRGADGSLRYAVTESVLSYAASARQLADAARRRRLPPTVSPAVVADPDGGALWAGHAAMAVRDAFYPGAVYLGRPRGASGGRRATPEEVLDLLPAPGVDGASMLQVSAHASAGVSPGDTALLLEDGRLPVAGILARARHRDPDAPGGLVVCDACVTDVAIDLQDEALTLATALLAAGAVSVIGTRWLVHDQSTAVMTYMFHHFLDGGRTRPADALRSAALWMLDPARPIPPAMPPILARHAGSADLADPYAWAGFVHHGQ